MSNVTMRQLKELFTQIDQGQITSESLQDFIERSSALRLSCLFKSTLEQARKVALKTKKDYCSYYEALAIIARTTAEPKDIELARKAAIEYDCGNMAIVVQALIRARRLEEARKLLGVSSPSIENDRAELDLIKASTDLEELSQLRGNILEKYCQNNSYSDARLVAIAEAQANAGDIEASRQTLVDVHNYPATSARLAIFKVSKDPADLETARKLVEGDSQWIAIAQTTREPQDIDNVRQRLSTRIKRLDSNDCNSDDVEALIALASVTRDSRDFERALKITRRFADQGVFLAKIAEGLAEAMKQ